MNKILINLKKMTSSVLSVTLINLWYEISIIFSYRFDKILLLLLSKLICAFLPWKDITAIVRISSFELENFQIFDPIKVLKFTFLKEKCKGV